MQEAVWAAAAVNGQWAEGLAKEQQGKAEQAKDKDGKDKIVASPSVLPWLLTLDVTAVKCEGQMGPPDTDGSGKGGGEGGKQEQAGGGKAQGSGRAPKVCRGTNDGHSGEIRRSLRLPDL